MNILKITLYLGSSRFSFSFETMSQLEEQRREIGTGLIRLPPTYHLGLDLGGEVAEPSRLQA